MPGGSRPRTQSTTPADRIELARVPVNVLGAINPNPIEPFPPDLRLLGRKNASPEQELSDSSERYLDELLALRCRRGDDEAWRLLVRRYERRLLYFIRRLVSNERDAYDVLQQTWMSAFDSLPRLKEPAALRTWLYRLARNRAASFLRGRGERIEFVDSAAIDQMSDDESPESSIDAPAETVHQALGALSLPHREVLTLFFLEDASIADIATILDISPGTVKSRLHYAKSALKSELERLEVQ